MLNDFYHMLDPVAISAGPITIYWYGLAYVVGALLTAVVMYRTQRRWGFNITIDDLTSVVVGVVFGLIIGAPVLRHLLRRRLLLGASARDLCHQ